MQDDPAYRAEQEELQRTAEAKRGRALERHRLDAFAALKAKRLEMLPGKIARLFEAGLSDTPALAKVREFKAQREQSTLVLAGAPGSGKSVAAAEAMHCERRTTIIDPAIYDAVVTDPDIHGRFVSAMDLARAGSYNEEARKLWGGLERTPVLVLDDFGTGIFDGAGYAAANLFNLLCRRYDNDLQTVITCNLSGEQFKHEIKLRGGARLLDRYREGADFFWTAQRSLRRKRSPTPTFPAAALDR